MTVSNDTYITTQLMMVSAWALHRLVAYYRQRLIDVDDIIDELNQSPHPLQTLTLLQTAIVLRSLS
jgi:hypothetical protein